MKLYFFENHVGGMKQKNSKNKTLFGSFPKMNPKLDKTARIQDEVSILFYSSLWMLNASLNSVILNSPLSRDLRCSWVFGTGLWPRKSPLQRAEISSQLLVPCYPSHTSLLPDKIVHCVMWVTPARFLNYYCDVRFRSLSDMKCRSSTF